MPDGSSQAGAIPSKASHTNALTKAILQELESFSRSPFQRILSTLLEAAPPEDKLRIWAQANPGKWGQLVKVFATLSGYTEKTESLITLETSHIIKMSDADLLTAITAFQRDPTLLISSKPKVIEHSKAAGQTENMDCPQEIAHTPNTDSILENSNTVQNSTGGQNSTAPGVRPARAVHSNPFK